MSGSESARFMQCLSESEGGSQGVLESRDVSDCAIDRFRQVSVGRRSQRHFEARRERVEHCYVLS